MCVTVKPSSSCIFRLVLAHTHLPKERQGSLGNGMATCDKQGRWWESVIAEQRDSVR